MSNPRVNEVFRQMADLVQVLVEIKKREQYI